MPLATFVSLIPPRGFAAPTGDAKKGFALIKTSGRSMIEMLGVLAIIGVLSAGGIWGYNQAMDAYTFNKFVKDTQTMLAGVMQAFPKPHTNNEVHHWCGETLNKLGILPDHLYKTISSPTSCYAKNPFTGKTDWKIVVRQSNAATNTITTKNGSEVLPANRFLDLYYDFYVSKKDCIKLLSYDWTKIAPKRHRIANLTYSYDYWVSEPLTIPEAQAICAYDANWLLFALTVHHQIKG